MSALASEEVAEIYQRYGHLLLRRCRLLVRDQVAAEDVLQEVFVKIMRYGGAYRASEAKLGWLYQVVNHCCYDALGRRCERAATPEQVERSDRTAARRPRHTDRIRTTRALERLPERERRLAVLAFVDGMSQDQIALEVGWSRQTVNRKLRTLRERLGRLLGGD